MHYWILFALVVLPLVVERVLLDRWRTAVAVRVHVHGSRGKSGTTRLLAAMLRSRGYRVLAKTTGDAPEYILPDGAVRPVRRWAPPRIQEHVSILRIAASMRADVVVVEGMALQPDTVFTSETILQATHAVITNVRPDHQETMGPGRRGVLRTLCLMLPVRGSLYTAGETGARILCTRAKEAGISCFVVPTASPLDQSRAVAWAVAESIATAMPARSGFESAPLVATTPPSFLPEISCRTILVDDMTVCFYDFFSANDVLSARLLWQQHASEHAGTCLRIALLATRADRPLRTRAFVDWLCREPRFDLVMSAGDHAGYALLRGMRTAPSSRQCQVAGVMPWARPQHLLSRLCLTARRRGCRELTIVGLGNTHGFGDRWRTFISGLEAR